MLKSNETLQVFFTCASCSEATHRPYYPSSLTLLLPVLEISIELTKRSRFKSSIWNSKIADENRDLTISNSILVSNTGVEASASLIGVFLWGYGSV